MRLTGAPARLLSALTRIAGTRPVVETLQSRPWASATFSGARHRLALRFSGRQAAIAADRLCENLAEREFELGPDLLVDIALAERQEVSDSVRLVIEALTVDKD